MPRRRHAGYVARIGRPGLPTRERMLDRNTIAVRIDLGRGYASVNSNGPLLQAHPPPGYAFDVHTVEGGRQVNLVLRRIPHTFAETPSTEET